MLHGPAAGLALLEPLDADARLRGHYRLDAVRAHLYERAGDHATVVVVAGQQVGVRALGHDGAVVQQHDVVGVVEPERGDGHDDNGRR